MDIILRETEDPVIWDVVVSESVVGWVKQSVDRTLVHMVTGVIFDLPAYSWQENTETFQLAVSEVAACVAKSRVHMGNLNEKTRAFAEACYHGFDSPVLKTMADHGVADADDCQTWDIDAEEWLMAVMAAWNKQLGVKVA